MAEEGGRWGRKTILSEAQLRRLQEYRYSSTSMSLLDPLFQPFWNWLTEQLPRWLAPNLLTLVGLLVNILTCLLLLSHSWNLKEPVPGWALVTCALGLFIYQSLDAVDGKQARRTRSSSPLGELFDHGCDSLGSVFLGLDVCVAAQLGLWPRLALFHCMIGFVLFYSVHWRSYVTGTLHFGLVDVTEAEVAIIFVQVVSGIRGSEFWAGEAVGGLAWGQILILVTTPFELFSMAQTLWIVIGGREGAGKEGSTVAGTSVLTPAIPISLALGSMLWVALGSEEGIYENHPALFISATGLVASKVTDHLIVATMTRSDIQFLDRVLILPGLMVLNQVLRLGIPELPLLWLTLVIAAAELWLYCRSVTGEICGFLKINLFTIS